MNVFSHIFQTILFAIILLLLISNSIEIIFNIYTIIFLISSLIGAIFPDIDIKNSYIRKTYPILSKMTYYLIFIIYLPIIFPIAKIKRKKLKYYFEHRKIFHSVFTGFILAIIFYLILVVIFPNIIKYIVLGFLFGYISHIIQDALTKKGVAPLLPFFETKISLGLITTGKFSETLFNIIVFILFITVILITMDENLQEIIKEIKQKIRELNPKKVLLEAPEGLKQYLKYISKELKNEGIEVYISGSSCYGPCDIDIIVAEKLNIDLIIHLGHTGEVIPYKNFNLKRD